MSSASRSMRRACSTTASPAARQRERRGLRSTSGTPRDSSSFLQLGGEGGLGDVAARRRAAEMARFGEGDQVFEVPERHRA